MYPPIKYFARCFFSLKKRCVISKNIILIMVIANSDNSSSETLPSRLLILVNPAVNSFKKIEFTTNRKTIVIEIIIFIFFLKFNSNNRKPIKNKKIKLEECNKIVKPNRDKLIDLFELLLYKQETK